MNSTWGYTAASGTANSFIINYPQSATISVAPTQPRPKGPLEWLRDQVDEVCRLAREP
jgi:hypothetical protein